MTALKDRIRRLIAASGPISVSDYMALCLFDPEHGYYMTRQPFGASGDFVTAPEISQMFGELVGAWLAATWQLIGNPAAPVLAEIGPGRGTLMKDILRTLGKIAPELHRSARFALIETSPRLAAVQQTALAAENGRIQWVGTVEELPEAPLLIVGNELFDAVPARQYVRTAEGWRERVVALDAAGELAFAAGAGTLDTALLPTGAEALPGAIFEIAPARQSLAQTLARRIARHGGAGLFIDYGHTVPGLGDTLQAVRGHAPDDPLAHPGEADLTTHVDFHSLAAGIPDAGLDAHMTTQGDFLVALGLLERAGRLGAGATATQRERLQREVERLVAPDQMGTLFKVLALVPRGLSPPGFTGAD